MTSSWLTFLAVKQVEDLGPAVILNDVDNGLCIKRSHVEHVTIILPGNIDGHAGRNVGHVERVSVGKVSLYGVHVVRSKQHAYTVMHQRTHWNDRAAMGYWNQKAFFNNLISAPSNLLEVAPNPKT